MENREANEATMGQTIEEVMEPKLETFEKVLIDVQIIMLKELDKRIEEAKRIEKE